MPIFKGFFLVVKKNWGLLLMFIGIFAFICVINVRSTGYSFNDTKPEVSIVIKEDTKLTQAIKNELEDKVVIVDIQESEVDDALFYEDISIALYIEEGFTEGFFNGTSAGKINYHLNNNSVSTYQVQSFIESFLALTKTYYTNGIITEDSVLDYMTMNKEQIDDCIDIEIIDNENKFYNARLFFDMLAYVLPAALITILGMVLIAFKPIDIQRRMNISPISNSKRSIILILGSAVLGVILLVACLILGKLLYGNVPADYEMLFYLNSFVFMIVMVALSYFIQTAVESKDAISALGVIISLGCSFFSGVFVPQEYLSKEILTFAKILPQYWFVKANDNMYFANGIANVDYNDLFGSIGIQLIFLVVFVVASIVVTRLKSKKEA